MARLLVADDDVEQLKLQACLLEELGHAVSIAISPADTLRQVAGIRPDLIVTDLRFPTAAAGLQLIRDLRAGGHQQPVIVLSGWPDDLLGAPEEELVSRVLVKGSIRPLLQAITELVG